MSLVAQPAMAAAIMMGKSVIPGANIPTAVLNALAVRTLLRRRKNQSPKDKGDHADEHQQQNSKMYPTGLGHPTSPLFPRLGRQFDSTRQA
ncbi:hypothetical protein FJV76_32055 [Mesorhizobium sp. WSM4303]|nr:hypothetical protein FJV77_32000 [Mesorhizobium sp. WSM4306]TRC93161.1 hypothetical protein FJV76_32055 [Mesorhizobium sp. WSM4303]